MRAVTGRGREAQLLFRPEALRVRSPQEVSSEREAPLMGRVLDVRFRGAQTMYLVAVEGLTEPVEVIGPARGPKPGEGVTLDPVDWDRIHLFPSDA